MTPDLPLSLLATMLLTALIAWPLRGWLLTRGLVDQPGERRSHRVPTPRGGGLALGLTMVLVLMFFAGKSADAYLVAGFVVSMMALGWLDDARSLPVRWRLLAQSAIGVLLIVWLGPVPAVSAGPLVLDWPVVWSVLGLVAVVWLMNLHNFMDGSDGLLAMQGCWTGIAMGALLHAHDPGMPGLLGFILAGACLGFMWWNRPPARLFLGDSGSIMLGGTIGLLALLGATGGGVSIWMSLIICSVFVVDATATLVRRAMKGSRWYTPHREHAYQRLISVGWGHGQVLVLYGLINLTVVLPALLLAARYPALEMPLALGLVGLLLAGWWTVQSGTIKKARST
jgi:Fuc2NAc and GlcNAc transferase